MGIGKKNRLLLESRVLIEDPVNSNHAPHRVTKDGLELRIDIFLAQVCRDPPNPAIPPIRSRLGSAAARSRLP